VVVKVARVLVVFGVGYLLGIRNDLGNVVIVFVLRSENSFILVRDLTVILMFLLSASLSMFVV
jgi:hypothetical protein